MRQQGMSSLLQRRRAPWQPRPAIAAAAAAGGCRQQRPLLAPHLPRLLPSTSCTRRMRIALGLKPLKVESEEPKGPTKAEQEREEEKKAAQAAELAARVKQ